MLYDIELSAAQRQRERRKGYTSQSDESTTAHHQPIPTTTISTSTPSHTFAYAAAELGRRDSTVQPTAALVYFFIPFLVQPKHLRL